MNLDSTTVIVLGLAGIIGLISWIWLIILAFKQSVSWGLIVLISPFLLGIIASLVVGPSMMTSGSGMFIYLMTAVTLLPFIFFGLYHFGDVKVPLILFILVNVVSAYYTSNLMKSMGMNEMMVIQQELISGKITDEEAQARMLAWAEKLEQSGMLSESDQRNLESMRDLMERSKKLSDSDDSRLAPKVGERSLADSYDPREAAKKRDAEAQRRLRAKIAAREKDKSRFDTVKKQESNYFEVTYSKIKDYLDRDVKITTANGITHSGTLSRITSGQDRIIISKEIGSGHADYALHRADIKKILVKKYPGQK